jgi:predicted membrane protein
MDIPTIVVICAVVASLALFLFLRVFRVSRMGALSIEFAFISAVWLFLTLVGEFVFTWAGNATCSKYLGCVEGFAGYDAFEHLFFGVAGALAILWFCERYPAYSILPKQRWKAFIIVVSLIALAAICWEIFEYIQDTVELDIFHIHLVDWRLHIDNLEQASNSDTMGDLTFALFGSIAGLLLRIRGRVIH